MLVTPSRGREDVHVQGSFKPSGVITLTTDFGHKGPFVGTMKGVMLARFPEARLIDLTHEIVVHWPAEAGFWLERAFRYFPAGTVHVAVVDPGVGTKRDVVVAERDGHVFLAPDNGLLAPVVGEPMAAVVHRLDFGTLAGLGLGRPSATFEGRDVFAPLAAELASGRMVPADLGPRVDEIVPCWVERPTVDEEGVSGVVITVDNFGNLITNIERGMLEAMKKPIVRAGGRSFRIKRTYGEVTPGEYLALINSFDVLEIARAEESAQEGLALGRGAPVVVAEE